MSIAFFWFYRQNQDWHHIIIVILLFDLSFNKSLSYKIYKIQCDLCVLSRILPIRVRLFGLYIYIYIYISCYNDGDIKLVNIFRHGYEG